MKFDRNGLTDLLPSELAALELKEEETGPIWISFQSSAGKKYKAVHWVDRSGQSAIRLMGRDKDGDDFEWVVKALVDPMKVAPKGTILDRGDDICQDLLFIELPSRRYFNQWIAERVETFYAKAFSDVTIERVYVQIPLSLTLKKNGTFIISPSWTKLESESDDVLMARTAFEEMELGEAGNIVVRGNDERWKKLLTFLLGGRFSPQRVQAEVVAV